ncbi:MAG: ribonuclease P protein component [Rhodobacteraceae bacterium]|nr:ribonuclease P protein component [Paracoccaceae bacterium]
MTPPVAPVEGQDPETVTPPAVSVCPAVLSRRADFLRAAQARRQGTPSFLLQARRRRDGEPGGDSLRVGFTCSKKVGNAVARNRAKRRLREAARMILPVHGRPGWDYVLVGRRDGTASRDFQLLLGDLVRALAQVHGKENGRER